MATLYYRPYTSDPITDGEVAGDAMPSQSLPDYEYIFPAPPTVRRPPAAGGVSNSLIPKLQNAGQDYISQLDGQLGEVEKYKDAMRKMGQDILVLRDRVRELEAGNSRLRRDLGNYADTAKILHDSVELDGIPKAELLARYAALKRQLTSTQSQAARCKEKVHRLQNELIQQHSSQDKLHRVASAHESQQQLLQQLQEKVAKLKRLEETCAKQEEKIERMEEQLQSRRWDRGQQEEQQAKRLTEENRQLREQMTRLKEAQAQASSGMESSERLELYQLLDTAEARVAALQHQLDSAARTHQREKQRLQEEIEAAERLSPSKSHRRRRRERPTPMQPMAMPQLIAVPMPVDYGRGRRYHDDSQSDDADEESPRR